MTKPKTDENGNRINPRRTSPIRNIKEIKEKEMSKKLHFMVSIRIEKNNHYVSRRVWALNAPEAIRRFLKEANIEIPKTAKELVRVRESTSKGDAMVGHSAKFYWVYWVADNRFGDGECIAIEPTVKQAGNQPKLIKFPGKIKIKLPDSDKENDPGYDDSKYPILGFDVRTEGI